MDFIIRQCTKDDVTVLQEISRQTYQDTFSTASTVADMEDYLQKAYDLVKLEKEILNKNTSFYFIVTDQKVVGYVKLNIGAAQTDIKDDFSLEIERIYVRKELHGQKFGAVLMNKAIEMAKTYQKQYIWLGVWENNQRAFNFYQKMAFIKLVSMSLLWERPHKLTGFCVRIYADCYILSKRRVLRWKRNFVIA